MVRCKVYFQVCWFYMECPTHCSTKSNWLKPQNERNAVIPNCSPWGVRPDFLYHKNGPSCNLLIDTLRGHMKRCCGPHLAHRPYPACRPWVEYPWTNVRHYPHISLDSLRKNHTNLCQDGWILGEDLNPGPPEYKAGVPPLDTLIQYLVLCFLLQWLTNWEMYVIHEAHLGSKRTPWKQ
jgi:hypothetical protein